MKKNHQTTARQEKRPPSFTLVPSYIPRGQGAYDLFQCSATVNGSARGLSRMPPLGTPGVMDGMYRRTGSPPIDLDRPTGNTSWRKREVDCGQ